MTAPGGGTGRTPISAAAGGHPAVQSITPTVPGPGQAPPLTAGDSRDALGGRGAGKPEAVHPETLYARELAFRPRVDALAGPPKGLASPTVQRLRAPGHERSNRESLFRDFQADNDCGVGDYRGVVSLAG